MASVTNNRALVSNLGDGNWGAGTGTENKIDAANQTIYFPPGLTKGAIPLSGTNGVHDAPGARSTDLVGWTSKTQWMVQLEVANLGTGGSPVCKVYAVRPTLIEEEVLSVTTTGSHSYGGFGDEVIQGPVAYFLFRLSGNTGGSPDIRGYVIGWNYGDISDGIA